MGLAGAVAAAAAARSEGRLKVRLVVAPSPKEVGGRRADRQRPCGDVVPLSSRRVADGFARCLARPTWCRADPHRMGLARLGARSGRAETRKW
jgi:hypothetical protein